jgi:hypothetical protein
MNSLGTITAYRVRKYSVASCREYDCADRPPAEFVVEDPNAEISFVDG